jgi:hypothetical protein
MAYREEVVCLLADSRVEHQRTRLADNATQDAVRSFHRGELPPKVSHLLSPARPG